MSSNTCTACNLSSQSTWENRKYCDAHREYCKCGCQYCIGSIEKARYFIERDGDAWVKGIVIRGGAKYYADMIGHHFKQYEDALNKYMILL